MDVRSLAQALPKVDVHCHLLGSIDLDTAVELAHRYDSITSRQVIEAAHRLQDCERDAREVAFFEGLDAIAQLLRTPEDLSRAVYGVVSHGARTSNLRYLELSIDASTFTRTGMSFTAAQEGLIEGAKAAEVDYGVRTTFIASIDREQPVATAREIVDNVVDTRRDEFVGIGLDGPEFLDKHRAIHFADVFHQAEKAGLRRTAHFCYFGADEYDVYADLLHCERIDHGYPVADDEKILERAAESGIPFTVCPTLTVLMAPSNLPQYLEATTHPIGHMLRGGLWIVPGTDDAAMVNTDIGAEYALLAEWYDWSAEDLVETSLKSISATWLDETDEAALRQQFADEIRALTTAPA